jgi:hypothetical protein
LVDRRRRGLYDMLAGTVVESIAPRVSLGVMMLLVIRIGQGDR